MKTIMITGASRGIGFELVKQYSGEPETKILACCRNPKNAKALTELHNKNDNILIYPLDVSDKSSITQLAEQLESSSIDILINNAGIYRAHKSIAMDVDVKEWLDIFMTNTIGHYLVSQAFAKQVASKKSKCKLIVNMSSRLGSMTLNDVGNEYMYRSSKAGLNAITKSLSIDFMKAFSIIVISLHPGWVRTDMAGQKATLDVAESVASIRETLALISEKDNGKFINYDGTQLAW